MNPLVVLVDEGVGASFANEKCLIWSVVMKTLKCPVCDYKVLLWKSVKRGSKVVKESGWNRMQEHILGEGCECTRHRDLEVRISQHAHGMDNASVDHVTGTIQVYMRPSLHYVFGRWIDERRLYPRRG